MAKSIVLAPDASRPASLLLSYIPAVCAFVAPRRPGASTAIIDRISHSRALSTAAAILRGVRRRVPISLAVSQSRSLAAGRRASLQLTGFPREVMCACGDRWLFAREHDRTGRPRWRAAYPSG